MHLSHVLIRGFAPALALFATAATVSDAPAVDPLVERYTQLDIRDFEKYTDAEINDAVFAGIHSDNPKIVELTVGALTANAFVRQWRRTIKGGDKKAHAAASKERDLRAVPGLRDFLLAYARSGWAEHGWGGSDELDFVDMFGEQVWRFVFLILVELYPQDPDVYALLDESYNDQNVPINLLNTGLFFHEAADESRIAALSASEGVAAEAAEGLAMSGSGRGLEALRRSLWRRDFALPAIAEALVVLDPSEVAGLRGLDADDSGLARELRDRFEKRVVAQAELAAGATAGRGELVPPGGAPHAGGSGLAPRQAVRTDADGVPLAANGALMEAPLDHALQLYDRYFDSHVNAAVAAGIGSGDARVVEQTVLTLGSYSMMVALRDWPVFGLERGEAVRKVADPRIRRLNRVPGLRAFLIDYAKAGMDDDACRAVGALGPRQPRPAWMQALTPLAVFFPGHAQVERLLLRFGECLERAGVGQSILPLLGIGMFRSDAVVRWHIDKLPQPHPTKARWAARGLARFLTDRGLAALVANLSRRDEALADVVEAVAAHGFRHAAPAQAGGLGGPAGRVAAASPRAHRVRHSQGRHVGQAANAARRARRLPRGLTSRAIFTNSVQPSREHVPATATAKVRRF